MSNLISIPVADLFPSRMNVRPYNAADDASLASLTASLLSIGLVQPIAVMKRKKGKGYEVIAGQRRLAAIKAANEQRPGAFETVEAIEITDTAIATEASLAENYVRSAMTLPEIYSAFARIRAERPNATLEELGAMFGFDAARAGRIMRLAGLSHSVMEAYRAGKIDDAQAQAFASTADQSLQDAALPAFLELPSYQRNGAAIRRLLGAMDSDQQTMMSLVGREAYVEAGGAFEEDLFQEGVGRLLHPEILRQLFDTIVDELKDQYTRRLKRGTKMFKTDGEWGLASLGFSWADTPPQITQYGDTRTDYELLLRIKPKPTDEDKRAIDDLEIKIDVLSKALDDAEAEADDPRWAEIAQLEKQIDEIEERSIIPLPKKGNVVGIARVRDGFDVDLYYASRAEAGKDVPDGAKAKSAGEATPAEQMRKRLGLTKDGAQALNLLRRDMVRTNLIHAARAGSTIPLDFLIYTQARSILRVDDTNYDGSPRWNGNRQGIETPASQEGGSNAPPSKVRAVFGRLTSAGEYDAARTELAAREWVTTFDPADGWLAYRQESMEIKDLAAGVVCCWGLMASTSYYGDGETPRMVNEIANYLDPAEGCVEWRETVKMDAAFFELMSHKIRRQLLESWGAADHPDGLKGPTSAAFCARVINATEEEAAALGINGEDYQNNVTWMHENLDTNMTPKIYPKD